MVFFTESILPISNLKSRPNNFCQLKSFLGARRLGATTFCTSDTGGPTYMYQVTIRIIRTKGKDDKNILEKKTLLVNLSDI
jgi:hypothetical protein